MRMDIIDSKLDSLLKAGNLGEAATSFPRLTPTAPSFLLVSFK